MFNMYIFSINLKSIKFEWNAPNKAHVQNCYLSFNFNSNIILIQIYVPLNAIIAYAKPLLQLEQDFLTLDLLMKQKSLNK